MNGRYHSAHHTSQCAEKEVRPTSGYKKQERGFLGVLANIEMEGSFCQGHLLHERGRLCTKFEGTMDS